MTKPVYWQAPVSACSGPLVYRWSNVLSSLCCCLISTSSRRIAYYYLYREKTPMMV